MEKGTYFREWVIKSIIPLKINFRIQLKKWILRVVNFHYFVFFPQNILKILTNKKDRLKKEYVKKKNMKFIFFFLQIYSWFISRWSTFAKMAKKTRKFLLVK